MAVSLILLIFAFVCAVVAIFIPEPWRMRALAASLAFGWLGLALGAGGIALH